MLATRLWVVICAAVLSSVAGEACLAGPTNFIPVTYVDHGPVIDGKLDDACWQKAKEIGGFTALADGLSPSKNRTFVRGVYDQQKLYLSFRCPQADTKVLSKHPRDGAFWFDDCIELFISPHITSTMMQTQAPGDQHFHLIVNSAGDQFDELGSAGPASWNGEWQSSASVTKDGWQIEIAIPFASLYFENFETRKNPPEMTVWKVQFGRTTAIDGDHSTLFPTKGMFKTHSGYGDLVFVSDPQDKTIRWKLDENSLVRPRIEKMNRALEQVRSSESVSLRNEAVRTGQTVAKTSSAFAAMQTKEYRDSDRTQITQQITQLERKVLSIQAEAVMFSARKRGDQVSVGSHPAIKDEHRVFLDSVPALTEVGQPVKAAVTPDEYQAASFVIWNEKPLQNLMVQLDPLAGDAGTLPAEAIDMRWVKCWYQAGEAADNVPVGKFLIPELLLKNPEMVTVDRVAEKNVLLDGYNGDPTARGYRDDAKDLLPIKQVDAKTSTQVWLTIHVPTNTAPGVYKGAIAVSDVSGVIAKLPIEVRVLGFALSRSMLENNWYAQTMWGDRKWITEERALVEMNNLKAHGADYVGLFERLSTLPEAVRLMKKAGLATDKIYMSPDGGDSAISLQYSTPASAAEMAKKWLDTAKSAGCDNISLYLIDEGREDVLKGEKPLAEAMRKEGVKTWVACYSNYFDIGGDFIDLANIANGPVGDELVKKIHAAGKRVFCYANPQGGVERPEMYRRNYGLLLWQHDYDGSFDWSWYWQFGPNENPNGWDDFNHPVYRDHMMVYPTKTGLVDTIQWEGWREAVNDTRYIATLIREIDAARKRGQQKAADDAQQWLTQLKQGGSAQLSDLDLTRTQVIEQIERCREAK